jgi:hypothetical protein
MTHPLFAGTPVDDLLPELQWIIASYLRHPVARLADGMSILFLTRLDRCWWYCPISQVDLFCTNMYLWNEEGEEYRFDRSDRISDLGYFTTTMWGRVPPNRPIKEAEAPRRRLLEILRKWGIRVKRGLSTYQLRLTLSGGTQPVRRWTLQPAPSGALKWVRAD